MIRPGSRQWVAGICSPRARCRDDRRLPLFHAANDISSRSNFRAGFIVLNEKLGESAREKLFAHFFLLRRFFSSLRISLSLGALVLLRTRPSGEEAKFVTTRWLAHAFHIFSILSLLRDWYMPGSTRLGPVSSGPPCRGPLSFFLGLALVIISLHSQWDFVLVSSCGALINGRSSDKPNGVASVSFV